MLLRRAIRDELTCTKYYNIIDNISQHFYIPVAAQLISESDIE